MRRHRLIAWLAALVFMSAALSLAAPYARALSLIVRAANMGGMVQEIAAARARTVTVEPDTTIPTRHGDLRARLYRP
ncbi:MAG: hypothetical protein ACREI7_11760, partial [Myxococcota bacterium]